MVLLITVLIGYLTHILWGSILTTFRVVGGSVDQVYPDGRDTNCCLTQLSIATISSSSSRISTGGLDGCSCQGSGLTVSRLGFFLFIRLRDFFFLIGPAAFLTASIYLLDTGRGLKGCLKLGLNGFIEHFVPGV